MTVRPHVLRVAVPADLVAATRRRVEASLDADAGPQDVLMTGRPARQSIVDVPHPDLGALPMQAPARLR